MNSYERVERVLNGDIPDRVPTFELMIDPKVIRGIIGSDSYMDLCDELDIDIAMSQTPSKMYREELVDEQKKIIRNEWGILRQYNDEIRRRTLWRISALIISGSLSEDLKENVSSAFISTTGLITAII